MIAAIPVHGTGWSTEGASGRWAIVVLCFVRAVLIPDSATPPAGPDSATAGEEYASPFSGPAGKQRLSMKRKPVWLFLGSQS